MVLEHSPDLIKPGNEEYLSYYKLQNDWKPVKTTITIDGISSSPGPAIVQLPSSIGQTEHDPTKTRAPAYRIGLKDDKQTFSCSPGPANYDIRKKTNKGEDECHAPAMGELFNELTVATSPGPAAYDRGLSDRYAYRNFPAYTMRPQTEQLKRFRTPAPSTYTLPKTLGPGRSPFSKSPCYTIGERLDKTGTAKPSPGPARYVLPSTDINKPKAPSFSMRTKDKSPSDLKTGIFSPGPASNEYHMVKFHKPSTPRFTFGIRHTPLKAFQHFSAD